MVKLPVEIISKILMEYKTDPYKVDRKESRSALASPFMLNKALTEIYLKRKLYSKLKLSYNIGSNIYGVPLYFDINFFSYSTWITQLDLTLGKDNTYLFILPFERLKNCVHVKLHQEYFSRIMSNSVAILLSRIRANMKGLKSIEVLNFDVYTREFFQELRLIPVEISVKIDFLSEPDFKTLSPPIYCVNTVVIQYSSTPDFYVAIAKTFPNLKTFEDLVIKDNNDYSMFPNVQSVSITNAVQYPIKLSKLSLIITKDNFCLPAYCVKDCNIEFHTVPQTSNLNAAINFLRFNCKNYRLYIFPESSEWFEMRNYPTKQKPKYAVRSGKEYFAISPPSDEMEIYEFKKLMASLGSYLNLDLYELALESCAKELEILKKY
eukprot:NODE_84_length_22354_cov_0.646506.p8 type:complete len:378 gc:universal NODE_84_length_22354_cov_0.646506:9511-8378(-)